MLRATCRICNVLGSCSEHAPSNLQFVPLLKTILDGQYEAFNVEDSATDPVQWVHRANGDAADREIVAFVAAGLAFGRVASVMASVGRVVDVMGAAPARFVREFDPRRDSRALTPI